ncbi:succinylglutamate desuccinylase/aspartoacylase family protein [Ottowia testudinis]|uniref:Succinylglutamate desuccinylase/aspartoacylase family protein n=1 Tax=Ottowia testudinis TaxID=2816950 RepID=A0A975CH78_9BURK|nr:succinylglutamate desuccinylase/aspartoacylase family protein [Ottowia testudinis]QTD45026.1 succinylglutamate desuccinylase/aspartoacylase family protein [Ottowia testudinis]
MTTTETLPPLLQRAVAQPDVLHWHTWAALAPGPSLVVLGAVHGNEVCGAHAIVRAIDDLTHGRLRLQRGRLTLVPVANPLAFKQKTREGERNLNRHFLPQPAPRDYEDRVTHQLAPLLAQHDALLDLHSFHTPGAPFAMVGPRDNAGAREPFARAAEEMALARALGAPQVVEGWLEVYDRAALARSEQPGDDGIGTNEYMRSQGGYAVTIECGQHEDPEAAAVATRAIHGALAHLGLADVTAPPRFTGPAARLKDVVLRQSPDDRLLRDWHSFDAVQAGDVIGIRADGTPVAAPHAGCVLFPHPEADVGQEWFYLAGFDFPSQGSNHRL